MHGEVNEHTFISSSGAEAKFAVYYFKGTEMNFALYAKTRKLFPISAHITQFYPTSELSEHPNRMAFDLRTLRLCL